MFSFAFIEDMFDSMRYSIVALIVFFVMGMVLLGWALRQKESSSLVV
jgi:MFS-type transporter involved in bile tolerance (Atg22 family)